MARDNAVLQMEEGASSNRQNSAGAKDLVHSNEPVTLSWEHVNVHVTPRSRPCCKGPEGPVKHVLKDVYGHVKPGSLMAIMGASGSGKTTLLNTITARANTQVMNVEGEIRVNGVNVGSGIRNISAYVQQDDLFIASMTVKEHLTFRALLRMDRSMKRKNRLKRVEEVIGELGLGKCADHLIGDPGRVKGISGGEMRRLSFASEILTNPPLLFCDEPTSGLDAYMAENIVQVLKTMANRGKTVMCTIHQPSSEVFALFDTLLIMAEGRVAYLGKLEEALEFFKSADYPCPANYNPADFYIKTLAVMPEAEMECRQRIEKVCDRFSKSRQHQDIMAGISTMNDNPKKSGAIFKEASTSSASRYESPWGEQFAAVFKRCWKTAIREPMVLRVKMIQTIILGVALGLIYLRLDTDQKGVMNINGAIFLVLTNLSFTNLFGVLNSFPIEVPVFLREYSVGLYRVDVYFLCKSLAELPGAIIIPFVFSAIVYWMMGLYETVEAFLFFVGISLLVANTAISLGYVVSAAANSVSMALAIAPPLMVPLLMFGGFFLNSDSIPVYFIWLEYLSWFKYANELLALNQWQGVGKIDCPVPSTGNVSMEMNPKCLFRDGDSVIEYLNFDHDNKELDYVCLVALLVGYRLVAFIVLFIKARMSKK